MVITLAVEGYAKSVIAHTNCHIELANNLISTGLLA